jgi:hypothetical protein
VLKEKMVTMGQDIISYPKDSTLIFLSSCSFHISSSPGPPINPLGQFFRTQGDTSDKYTVGVVDICNKISVGAIDTADLARDLHTLIRVTLVVINFIQGLPAPLK